MASYNKFNIFTQDIGRKVHNLNSDTLKIMLTNTAPVATNTVDGNLTEISAGNGYSAGGTQSLSNTYANTSGTTAQLTSNDVVFTASGGSIGNLRYAVYYNATAGSSSNRPLIGWWDYTSSITLASGETFTVDLDGTNGVLQIT